MCGRNPHCGEQIQERRTKVLAARVRPDMRKFPTSRITGRVKFTFAISAASSLYLLRTGAQSGFGEKFRLRGANKSARELSSLSDRRLDRRCSRAIPTLLPSSAR